MLIQNIYNTPNINCLQIILSEEICKGIYFTDFNIKEERPRTLSLIYDKFKEIENITIFSNKIIICNKGLSKIENKKWTTELVYFISERLPFEVDANIFSEINDKYFLHKEYSKCNEDGGTFVVKNNNIELYGACRDCMANKIIIESINKKIKK